MGDILSLIEKVEQELDSKKAEELEKKLKATSFDFEDFLQQMRQMKKLGPIEQLLGLLPGMGAQLKGIQFDDRQIARIEAMILSMTPHERRDPSILVGSRRRRVAAGSGSTVQEVNNLISKFEMMRQFVRRGLNGIDPNVARQGALTGAAPYSLPGSFGSPTLGKHAGSNRSHKKNKKKHSGIRFGR